jgi:leucyl-tRNA synthetase
MFMGPLEATKPWQSLQLMGVVRFRDRVYQLAVKQGLSDAPPTGSVESDMHKVIKKVTQDIDKLSFNTAISSLMVYSSALTAAAKGKGISGQPAAAPLPRQAVETLVLLLSPFAPHAAEESWRALGHSESLAYAPWPAYREELCVERSCNVVVQINGKVRGVVEGTTAEATQEEVWQQALENNGNIAKLIQGATIKKKIFVPGKVLNIII